MILEKSGRRIFPSVEVKTDIFQNGPNTDNAAKDIEHPEGVKQEK